MIVVLADLIALTETLPEGTHLVLPNTIEVERPGEPVGQLFTTAKGLMAYRSYQ